MVQKVKVELLADGNYKPEDIKLDISHEPIFRYDKELQDKLDKLWDEQKADAKKREYKLWNSETYALKKVEENDGQLTLDLGLVEYRNNAGIVKLFEAGEIGPELCSPLMYCSILVRTSDSKYIFGIGKGFAHHGELKFVGGSYSKKDIELKDGNTLFQLAYDEIKEELNVDREQIQDMELVRIYRTPRGMIDLTYTVQLTVNADEVKALYDGLKEKELAKLLIFTLVEAKVEVGASGGQRAMKVDLIY